MRQNLQTTIAAALLLLAVRCNLPYRLKAVAEFVLAECNWPTSQSWPQVANRNARVWSRRAPRLDVAKRFSSEATSKITP